MNPIKFKSYNFVYAKEQPQYENLPVYRTKEGSVTSVWKPTWVERLKILFGFKIALTQWTFNEPLQPVNLYLYDAEDIKEPKEKRK